MKKKPPPGATLIARLREQRLAREAALIEKDSPETKADKADKTTAAAADKKSTKEPVARKAQSEEVEKVGATVVRATPAVAARDRDQVDLIHRDIDIGDLRPTTDDYFQLTDEIRLAGRFAAVGLIAQGLRLARLKDDEIYKNHFPSFEEYCRKEHQMSATYAYRLIRMAEMAERIAERGPLKASSTAEVMPDPFEVMLGLGHRHLMALLPLEPDAAEELLVNGIPLVEGDSNERVPINKATEKQIRLAFKAASPSTAIVARPVKKALASEKQMIPALNKLVEMLEDWSAWLGSDPQELKAARMGRGPLLTKLSKRFRNAAGRISEALENNEAN